MWDLEEELCAPPHSVLYPIEPIGVGTSWVESQTSYLGRLAREHRMLMQPFLLEYIAPALNSLPPDGSTPRSEQAETVQRVMFFYPHLLNGGSAPARRYCNALERLTLRADIVHTSLLGWGAALRSRCLLRERRAWCCGCYDDWRATGATIYEPLLWNLQVVTCCTRHELRLPTRCPQCAKPNRLLHQRYQPGHCSLCGCWLGASQRDRAERIARDELDWQIYAQDALGAVFAHKLSASLNADRTRLSSALKSLLMRFSLQDLTSIAQGLQVHRNSVRVWSNGGALPSLELLLRLCDAGQVPFHAFLTQEQAHWPVAPAAPLMRFPAPQPKLPLLERRMKNSEDSRHITEMLHEEPPPSLEMVAVRLQRTRRNIKAVFPKEYRALTERHRAYENEQRQRDQAELLERVFQALRVRLTAQLPITYSSIASDVGQSLWGYPAREAYRLARRAVGLDS